MQQKEINYRKYSPPRRDKSFTLLEQALWCSGELATWDSCIPRWSADLNPGYSLKCLGGSR